MHLAWDRVPILLVRTTESKKLWKQNREFRKLITRPQAEFYDLYVFKA